MLAVLVLLGLTLPPVPAQVLPQQAGTTSVHIRVLGANDQPVAGLRLMLRDDARALTVQTDATGTVSARGLAGAFLRVTDAALADGSRLLLDPTTVHDGLRFGLIPGQERKVVLRLDNGLLFLDPEMIFAGTAPEATPTSAPVAGANLTVRSAPQPGDPPAVSGASGVSLVLLVMLGILTLPALGAAIWWLGRVRAYRRARR
jgi:hypothetical protein